MLPTQPEAWYVFGVLKLTANKPDQPFAQLIAPNQQIDSIYELSTACDAAEQE